MPEYAAALNRQEKNLATPLRYRQATPGDIPAMSAIRLSVRENVLSDPGRISPQMYRDYLDLYGRGWVAEVDGVIAGFSYADRRDGSIWALFVAPAYEGRGLGQALLRLAVTWLFDQGHDKIELSTGKDTRADRFYAAQGWTRVNSSERDAYYQFERPACRDVDCGTPHGDASGTAN